MNIPQAKAQIKSKQKKPASVRIQEITDLAAEGNNSSQIESLIGLSAKRVRRLAKTHDITIPGDVTSSNLTLIKPRRAINETCLTLSACATGINLIINSLEGITAEEAKDWVDDISTSLKPINKLYRTLRGIANRE